MDTQMLGFQYPSGIFAKKSSASIMWMYFVKKYQAAQLKDYVERCSSDEGDTRGSIHSIT